MRIVLSDVSVLLVTIHATVDSTTKRFTVDSSANRIDIRACKMR